MVRADGYRTARDIVVLLRQELLAMREGEPLGSVEDLMRRFAISRSTLRQAVRVLEHEELLTAKRGVSGGFFAARPRMDSVVSSATTYLNSRDASLWDFIPVARTLNIELARLAAACQDRALIEELEQSLAIWRSMEPAPMDMLKADQVFERLLTRMAGNPVIELLLSLVYRVGLRTLPGDSWPLSGEPALRWRRQRLDLGEAIVAGDADRAMQVAARHYDLVGEWLHHTPGGNVR